MPSTPGIRGSTINPSERRFRLLPDVRGLPRAYWYLWAGALVNRLGSFVVPFLALYLTRMRGLSVERAGLVVALFGAGVLASGPIGGVLADRFGRRITMVLSLALGGAAMLHLGFARTPMHIAIATLLLGLFGEMYRPAVQAAVADLAPPEDRARAYAFLYWAVNLGFSIAPVVAGLMASRSFTALFVGDALTSFAFAAIVWLRVPETRPTVAAAADKAPWSAPYRDRVFIAFAVLTIAIAFVFHQSISSLPLDMSAHEITPERFGLIIALNGVLIVVLQPYAMNVLARTRRSRVLAAGSLLTGVGFGLTAFAHDVPMYLVSIFVWTLGEIALSPVTPAVVSELAPPSLRGTYQGAFHLTWGGAALGAPAIGTLVLGRFGGGVLWSGCAIVGVLVAMGHIAIAPARRRRLDALKA